jgi:hypothetical protein
MKLSVKEQLDLWDRFADEAYDILVDFVIEKEDEIREMARARCEQYVEEYGDTAWFSGEESNMVEAMPEASDTLNYIIYAIYGVEMGK